MNDTRTKLLQNPLPIDRVAARVVKKAKPEQLWRPMPKEAEHIAFSSVPLATQELKPGVTAEIRAVQGRRRGRMLIVGYAAEQPFKKDAARWVVRCDCGNYEHRVRILRWLGTEADDACRECLNRAHLLGRKRDPVPAPRATVQAAHGGAA